MFATKLGQEKNQSMVTTSLCQGINTLAETPVTNKEEIYLMTQQLRKFCHPILKINEMSWN